MMKTKKLNFKAKTFVLIILLLCIAIPIFAQSQGITALDTAVTKVKNFLSSGTVTVVCLLALVVEAVGVVVMGKQGADVQAIISKFAPWVVGTVVLLAANGICDFFLKDLKFS